MKLQHFCGDPRKAVCGQDLRANDFKMLYEQTTNNFADITCEACRQWIREHRLRPIGLPGFEDPAKWTQGVQGDSS